MNKSAQIYDVKKPLHEHLDEFRVRLIRFLLIFIALVIFCWIKNDIFFSLLMSKSLTIAQNNNVQFTVTDLLDRFWINFKITLLGALILSLPVLFFEFYQFVKPGLKKHERRLIFSILISIPILFLFGLSLWNYIALPESIKILLSIGDFQVMNHINLLGFVSFTLFMGIIFGLLFQLPLLIIALVKLKIISIATIKKYRKHTYILLCIISAVATPSPDAFSMLVLWIPLIILYELTLIFTQHITPFGSEGA